MTALKRTASGRPRSGFDRSAASASTPSLSAAGDGDRQAGMQATDHRGGLRADDTGAADDENGMLYAGHLMVSMSEPAARGLAFLLKVTYYK
jgi:hypothetical protein